MTEYKSNFMNGTPGAHEALDEIVESTKPNGIIKKLYEGVQVPVISVAIGAGVGYLAGGQEGAMYGAMNGGLLSVPLMVYARLVLSNNDVDEKQKFSKKTIDSLIETFEVG